MGSAEEPLKNHRPLMQLAEYSSTPLRASADPEAISSNAAKRVLIADDEPGIRYILERALGSVGYNASSVSNGEEAWEALSEEYFDLLITDHDMPRLTGVNLLRRIRGFSSSLPVLLVSGQMPWDVPDLLELLRPGFVVEKPFSFDDLLGHVNLLIGENPSAASAYEDAPKGESERDDIADGYLFAPLPFHRLLAAGSR